MSRDNRDHRIQKWVDEIMALPQSERAEAVRHRCGDDLELQRDLEDALRRRTGPSSGTEPDTELTVDSGDASPGADQVLLLGILALQLQLITRGQFKTAFRRWVQSKTTPLEQILQNQGAIDAATGRLLNAMIDKQLELDEGNALRSLAALSSIGDVKRELEAIDDSDINATLFELESGDSAPTVSLLSAVGNKTSEGGRFRVLRPHAKGGLGRVSVALDSELHREVALKEILGRHANHPEHRNRFLLEAEITGGLQHPGIVPVYGLGQYEDGKPFYAMRFVQGDSLKEALGKFHEQKNDYSASQRALELRKLLKRFVDVCEAIGYAHSRQILHRDIKPGNIMLGKYGETLVVDWGLAKATGSVDQDLESEEQPLIPTSDSDAVRTTMGTTVGTPAYMSPEQASGLLDQLGPTTDVYSLGATLYCLLAGRPPFKSKNREDVLKRVRRGDFQPPRELDSKIPRALEAICLRAMELKPAERYPSPLALSHDVELWLADEPVEADEEPWIDRIGRALRKNQTAVVGLSAIVLSALAGAIAIAAITQSKNAQLSVMKDQVEENLDVSRKLGLELVNLVTALDDELAQAPKIEEKRIEFLDRSMKIFDRLHVQQPAELSVTRHLAQLHRYSANVERLNSRNEEAMQQYGKSVSLLEEALQAEPGHRLTRDRMAETLRDYTSLAKRLGKIQLATESIERSIEIAEGLRREFPESPAYKRTEATSLLDAGSLNRQLARPQPALQQLVRAGSLLIELVDGEKPGPSDEPLLVLTLLLQSAVLRDLDRSDEALLVCEEIGRRIDARGDNQETRGHRHTHARSQLETATVQSQTGVALVAYKTQLDQAIETWTDLVEKFPETSFYPQYLARALALRGGQTTDVIEAARDDFQRARDLVRSVVEKVPDDVNAKSIFGEVLAANAQFELKQNNAARGRELLELALGQLQLAVEKSPESKRIENIRNTVQEQLNSI